MRFGHLTHSYSKTHMTIELGGQRTRLRYRVLGKDACSVVIEKTDDLTGQMELLQLFFEGQYYWFQIGTGKLREWFRKMK